MYMSMEIIMWQNSKASSVRGDIRVGVKREKKGYYHKVKNLTFYLLLQLKKTVMVILRVC